MSRTRSRTATASLGLVLAVPVVLGSGTAAQALPGNCTQAGAAGPVTCSYASGTIGARGLEQTFDVPRGVTAVTVTAVGAAGGRDGSGAAGGQGAVVTGTVPVTPLTTLYVEVGTKGGDVGGLDGFLFDGSNGGGHGQQRSAFLVSAGGGGASDVRTVAGADAGTLASRLLVAGGGGGAGGSGTTAGSGAAGGDAGAAGGRTGIASPPGSALPVGENAGQPGTATRGGAAGSGGGFIARGSAGTDGAAGTGGNGGAGVADPGFPDANGTSQPAYGGGGGGGGGGLFGGGGGGGGGAVTPIGPPTDGGGGGGGGASLVPAGGTSTLAGGRAAEVTISYTPPVPALHLSPAAASIGSGGLQGYTVSGVASDGGAIDPATTTLSIAPDGSCSGLTCTATRAGAHVVTARNGTLTDTAALTVTPGPLARLLLSPATASVAVGQGQPYRVEGRDAADNSLGDVTAGTAFSIGPDGSCAGATCTPAAAGTHTVTASQGDRRATAALEAVAGAVTRTVTLREAGRGGGDGRTLAVAGGVADGGTPVAGAPVLVNETYADGQVVALGRATTGPDGSYHLTVHPQYSGTLTAFTGTAASRGLPHRVALSFRRTAVTVVGRTLTLTAQVRPGYVTGAGRNRLALDLAVTDAAGRTRHISVSVGVGGRLGTDTDTHGYNTVRVTVTLPTGSYLLTLSVPHTPVTAGGSSRGIRVRIR